MAGKRFTAYEYNYIKRNYKKKSDEEIAAHLNCSPKRIKKKREHERWQRKKWSKQHLNWLRENYHNTPMQQIVAHLKRSVSSIYSQARDMNLGGRRYSINNVFAGKAYNAPNKKANGRTAKPKPAKPSKDYSITSAVIGRKGGAKKDKKVRWQDRKHKVKAFSAEGKKLVRIDAKTLVYVPANATEKEIETIVSRYKKAI